MRTAVRRLRAGLTLRRQVAPELLTDSLRAELAWLEATVAGLEDVDSTRRRIRAALAREPKELLLGPVSRRTDRELAAARKTALAAVRAMLDSERYLRLVEAVHSMATSHSLPPVSGRARDVLPGPADRAVRRAGRRLGQLRRAQSDGERRWQLLGARRAVERARYAESLVPGRTPDVTTSELLDDIADVLAEMETGMHTQSVLRELGLQAQAAGESAFTFGRLHGLEELHAADLTRQLTALRKALKRTRSG
jgi:hypothetical protein